MTGPSYGDRSGAPIPPEPGGDPYRAPAAEPGGDPSRAPAGETYGGPAPDRGVEPGPTERAVPPGKVPQRTRVSGIWVASIAAVVVLLLLLIFILQNGNRVKINIFGANPTLPLGVALLLAAVLGALLVALVGAARVVQLRHTARRMARRSR
jgi:uncharacterized integral membrane protein